LRESRGSAVHREEVTRLDAEDGVTIVASGPLTSPALSAEIARLTGSEHLAFYDSISPIVEADSIDREKVYLAARYDKGTADYINCPMTQAEYEAFHDALLAAESVEAKEWEKLEYFEGCLPIEELARRGRDTLRFGPMKPVGLINPRTGKMPWAVVQLRVENLRADSYNLVGFQNHMKFGEQARIFRMIPGLEQAKFCGMGRFIGHLYQLADGADANAASAEYPRIFFAGQISGVEGYTESIATGMLGGDVCGGDGAGREAGTGAAGDGAGVAGAIHHGGGCETVSTGQTSRSICWSRWMRRRGGRCGTSGSGTGLCASERLS